MMRVAEEGEEFYRKTGYWIVSGRGKGLFFSFSYPQYVRAGGMPDFSLCYIIIIGDFGLERKTLKRVWVRTKKRGGGGGGATGGTLRRLKNDSEMRGG